MKIIDRKTGKRLAKTDPLKRNAYKDLDSPENSPMDPPEAFDEKHNLAIDTDHIHKAIQVLLDEHETVQDLVSKFEDALKSFVENNHEWTEEINQAFSNFYSHLDTGLAHHNAKEEKALFNILHKKLKESGEHSDDDIPRTAVNLMEDDHNQFVQLGTLSFNMFGLASRLKDPEDRMFVLNTATQTARELIELIRLHIYREENKVFPLAQQLISDEEFDIIYSEMEQIA
jgi:hemerythrin-like domain-containing protein